ncbi:MAG: FAD-binding oxidoreductase [Limnochordia bacterium]|jgi:sarcosine oxidase subunit beta|nr:FAD-binding oxidoreductase [Limnochordia bacterium]MDI9465543.1 FAD-binding oxidoreductase [Bacillota bacterium]NLO95882.1 FAD-binding oxidoreductase [Bacillota bacterium]HAN95731.1 sulfurtransferase [Bacillota bacterium]HOB40226.1 FAD-binding oxidoreductase [Limnochordia bacterium]
MKNYDVVIVGAGSVGLPLAHRLAARGVRVGVVDELSSPGQGQNKAAIGGIRATHSDRAKIQIGIASLEFVRRLEEDYGEDVDWVQGGYLFPAYDQQIAENLKALLPIQKGYGLNIDWIGPEEVREIVPGIRAEGLLGGTFSPEDGHLSSLKLGGALYRLARRAGAEFHFETKVTGMEIVGGRVTAVLTDKGKFGCGTVVNAAGAFGREVGQMVGADLPVYPDSHEAGVTEPIQPLFNPMLVDIAPDEHSDNYYFYQAKEGAIVFCITPRPKRMGTDRRSTSEFLPMVIPRMLNLYPRLRNIRVRRVWRGLYPMTPDGVPIVGFDRDVEGFFHAVGMCGQGLMLGPGLAEIAAEAIVDGTEPEIFADLSPYRDFSGEELLK